MASLPYDERVYAHYAAKPYSIDPFNEADLPQDQRDSLLVAEFLKSYEGLAHAVSQTVNDRYFRMGEQFA